MTLRNAIIRIFIELLNKAFDMNDHVILLSRLLEYSWVWDLNLCHNYLTSIDFSFTVIKSTQDLKLPL